MGIAFALKQVAVHPLGDLSTHKRVHLGDKRVHLGDLSNYHSILNVPFLINVIEGIMAALGIPGN